MTSAWAASAGVIAAMRKSRSSRFEKSGSRLRRKFRPLDLKRLSVPVRTDRRRFVRRLQEFE